MLFSDFEIRCTVINYVSKKYLKNARYALQFGK